MAKTELYTLYMFPYGAPTNGVSGSYMDAIFETRAHETLEIWASLPHAFTKEGLHSSQD